MVYGKLPPQAKELEESLGNAVHRDVARRTVRGQGGTITYQDHPGNRPAALGRVHRQYFKMPAGHARPGFRQPQTDARGNEDMHSVSA